MKNPWLNIFPEDYEGHMSDANVSQLEALSEIFGKVIMEYHPQSIMLLGCATGNGLENLNGDEKIIGVDINPLFLDQCKKRFAEKLSHMNLLCADLNTFEYNSESFDLIHAALIFEYVNVENLLKKSYAWLNCGGCLSVVLQMESKTAAAISKTEFVSLKSLQPIHNLVDADRFNEKCVEIGFRETNNYEVRLPGEKKFKVIIFQKGD